MYKSTSVTALLDVQEEQPVVAPKVEEKKWPDIPHLNVDTLVPSLNPTLVVDGAGLEKVRNYFTRVNEYGFDYETNLVERFYHRKARTIQVGDRYEQYVIDLLAFAGSTERLQAAQGLYRKDNAVSEADRCVLDPVVDVLRPSLESNSHLKVGHFLEFEYIVSKWCLGIRAWHFWCTYQAERSLSNGLIDVNAKDYFGLDDLVRRYCRFQISKDEQKGFDLETPLTQSQITYCALDVRLPLVIKGAQQAKVNKAGLSRTVQIDMNAIPAFGDMHLNGMLIDKAAWQQIIEDKQRELAASIQEMDKFILPIVGRKVKWDQAEIDRLEQVYRSYDEKSPEEIEIAAEIRVTKKNPERLAELREIRAAHEAARKQNKEKAKAAYYAERAKGSAKAREEYSKMIGEAAINYNSSDQLLSALHAGGFGLNAQNFKDTSDPTMEKFANLSVIKAIRTHRSLAKSLSTYGDRWIITRDELCKIGKPKPGFIDPDTGRIHSRFKQFGADTGRPASTNPNLLNIPRGDAYRDAFMARPGNDLIDRDVSGQELRNLVEYTQEPVWLEAFRNGKDVHSMSAQMLKRKVWDEATNMVESMMMVNGKLKKIPPCAYYYKDREKCECPMHKEIRNMCKALTLGKVMGKTIWSFAVELGLSKEETQKILDEWEMAFRITERTLEKMRNEAYNKGEARTLAGRRRIITPVSYERAKKVAADKYKDKVTQDKITQTMQSLIAAVKREGGNVPMQGTAVDQMHTAIGCGFDPDGKPYLWHILPKYDAELLLYVYDELLVEAPEQYSKEVDDAVVDAIMRSGAEFVKSVPMASEGGVSKSKRWQK